MKRFKFLHFCYHCQTTGESQIWLNEAVDCVCLTHKCTDGQMRAQRVEMNELNEVPNFPIPHVHWRKLRLEKKVSSMLIFESFKIQGIDSCTIDKAIANTEVFEEMLITYSQIPLT